MLGDNPYWVFISFLFAWIAADIAQRFITFNDRLPNAANSSPPMSNSERRYFYFPACSHLVLAAIVVGTSWVGWTLAIQRQQIQPLNAVIGAPSLLLIVDFWILATYFAFVALVDRARSPIVPDGTLQISRSAHAAFWVGLIFISYTTWDFFYYWLIPRLECNEPHFVCRSWMTVGCLILAWLAYHLLKHVKQSHPCCVAMADGSLIFLILFFRGLKQLAYPAAFVPTKAATIKCNLPICCNLSSPASHARWLEPTTWIFFGLFFVLLVLAFLLGRRDPNTRQRSA